MDNLPATMTLGRRGHYASGRAAGGPGGGPSRGQLGGAGMGGGVVGIGDGTDRPLMGPNTGQYATLSKQCKTLESSDFY